MSEALRAEGHDSADVLPHKKPELLAALFSLIPDQGCGWPADRRAIWLKALTNALELLYGVQSLLEGQK
jgi:hypothetical protein